MSALSLTRDTEDLAQYYEDASADRQFKAGQILVTDFLDVAKDEKVLDVGSGTGLLAEYVADIVGPQGSVTGIDPLPLRIELAKRKSRPNLSFEVGNAYDLSRFPEGNFDVVYLNAVFHWFPEKIEPLRQFARVLRPGGRIGFLTNAKGQGGQIQAIRTRVLAREPYNRHSEAAGPPYQVDADELAALLSKTGFRADRIELVENGQRFATPQAVIDFVEASSFGNYLGHLPETLRAAAEDDIRAELEKLVTPEGILQGGFRIFAGATRI